MNEATRRQTLSSDTLIFYGRKAHDFLSGCAAVARTVRSSSGPSFLFSGSSAARSFSSLVNAWALAIATALNIASLTTAPAPNMKSTSRKYLHLSASSSRVGGRISSSRRLRASLSSSSYSLRALASSVVSESEAYCHLFSFDRPLSPLVHACEELPPRRSSSNSSWAA